MGHGYKGKKKRSLKMGDGASTFAPPADDVSGGVPLTIAAEGSHGSPSPPLSVPQLVQVKPVASTPCNAGQANRVDHGAFPFTECMTNPVLDSAGSSFQRPTKTSSVQLCRFFQRGYCRAGNYCRFQHSEPSGATSAPEWSVNSTAKAKAHAKPPSQKSCAPEECKDCYLTGSCPRHRTCRYAHHLHSPNFYVENSCNNKKAAGMRAGGFENRAAQSFWRCFDGEDDWMVEQMFGGSCGFSDDDIEELAMQGIRPWDPEAQDALAVLNGYY